jgi:hypothetical protein
VNFQVKLPLFTRVDPGVSQRLTSCVPRNHPHLTSEETEFHRDRLWRLAPELRVEDALAAERLVEDLGFCFAMTDSRRPGPSLYLAVCGRRDACLPRNVQTDPESSLTWFLKDELMSRGRVYYAKLVRARSTFIARRLISAFNALWGVPRRNEAQSLTPNARAILRVMRREWEMASADLRKASGVNDRPSFNRALDELQRCMKVIPAQVIYKPVFTYIWMLAEGRFPEELSVRMKRPDALREVARAFLAGAGLTARGELAQVTGLTRADAGIGNHALVDEGFAERLEAGVYQLAGIGSATR